MRAVPAVLVLLVALGSSAQSRRPDTAPGPPAGPPVRTGPPAWAADAVWYQVLLERFRNGDPRNDPKPADLRGASPHETVRDWHVSPWTSDWYVLQPWEKADGHDFYWNAPLRRYGGDLQGLLDKLEHIQALGVNAIYLNPVFEAPSHHKYDAAFLHHVDGDFGPDPEGDRIVRATENPADPSTWKWTSADRLFLRLVQECHRRQIRVILDGVFDHVGLTFWAFRDVRAKGEASKYAGWFQVSRFDDPKTPADDMEYAFANGAREMPLFRREGSTLAAGPRDHIRAIIKRWGDPNGDGDPSDGVDGWRLDGADRVGHGFWKELRRWVVGLNPDAYLVGDAGWEDYAAGRLQNPDAWLRGDELDAVVNYRWADVVKAFFVNRQTAITASDFDTRLSNLRASLSPEATLAMMDVVDTHDTERLASMIVNPDRAYDHQGSPRDDPKYDVRAPREDEWRRLRLVAAFQFAYPGAPHVLYGTEVGMWGADDPDSRKPMVWREARYDDEAAQPLGQPRKKDPVRFDEELYKYYQTLGKLRAAQPALARGSYETVLTDDVHRAFAFGRTLDPDRVVAVFNAGDKELRIEVAFAENARDLLSSRRYRSAGGKVSLVVGPVSAILLARDAKTP
jgi:cyclomaltodextrinase / maltogenic alpha-amylase / neopullulanase